MRRLTLLITLWKTSEEDIHYWREFYENNKNNDNFQIQFLIDEDCNEYNLENVNTEDIFLNGENIGKLKTIYNHIKKGNVKTEYFKTVDPDDRILIDRLNNFNYPKETSLIRMKSFRSVENKNSKISLDSFGTSWMILPTSSIEFDDNYDGTRININDDQILGNISYINNGKVYETNDYWYLYYYEKGISSLKNFPENIKKLLETLKYNYKLTKELDYTIPSNWPGNLEYYKGQKEKYESNFRKLSNEENEIWETILSFTIDRIEKEINWEQYAVCLFSDKNQVDYALSSILNMSRTSTKPINFFLILESNYKSENKKITKIVDLIRRTTKSNLTIQYFDNFTFPKYKSNVKHITKATNMRLFISEIIPNNIKKVVYLDNDVFVNGDIADLIDFYNKRRGHYGRTWNHEHKYVKEFKKRFNKDNSDYYNAGVLLLDLELMRQSDHTSRVIEFCKVNKELKYADQDVLNATLNIKKFPWFFNIARDNWGMSLDKYRHKYDTRIFHFLSTTKPWNKIEDNIKDVFNRKIPGTLTFEEFLNSIPYAKMWKISYDYFLNKVNNPEIKNNSLSILMSIYEPTLEDVERWRGYSFELEKLGIDFHLVIDNPQYGEIGAFSKKTKIYKNKSNLGKFESLFNLVKSGKVKTSHFKIADPDDEINIEALEKVSLFEDSIILMENHRKNQQFFEKKSMWSFGTSWTILPTWMIQNDKYYESSKTKTKSWIEDQVFGVLAQLNGATVYRSKDDWYIYNKGIGITSSSLTEEIIIEILDSLELIKNLLWLIPKNRRTNFPGELSHISKLIKQSNLELKIIKKYIRKLYEYKTEEAFNEFLYLDSFIN